MLLFFCCFHDSNGEADMQSHLMQTGSDENSVVGFVKRLLKPHSNSIAPSTGIMCHSVWFENAEMLRKWL